MLAIVRRLLIELKVKKRMAPDLSGGASEHAACGMLAATRR